MDMNKWNSGPPPSIGWWPASFNQMEGVFRWWNGTHWSRAATRSASASNVALLARTLRPSTDPIQWMHRPSDWPARSRT